MPVTRCVIIAACAAMALTSPAVASKPVPKSIIGCVTNGTFVSSDGYDIRPIGADGKPIDLRPFEGHALTINGDLLPGDILIVKGSPRDGGPCRSTRPVGK